MADKQEVYAFLQNIGEHFVDTEKQIKQLQTELKLVEKQCQVNGHHAATRLLQLDSLQTEFAELNKPCEWKKAKLNTKWEQHYTSCGNQAGIIAVGYKFCPYCRRPIKEIK